MVAEASFHRRPHQQPRRRRTRRRLVARLGAALAGESIGRVCRERLICDGGRCEMRTVHCPLCGGGPYELKRLFLHPVRVNHLAVWSCARCLRDAVERLG
jgi:hypothetical protein